MTENIIQDDSFDIISYDFNLFSPQDDFSNLSFFEKRSIHLLNILKILIIYKIFHMKFLLPILKLHQIMI